MQNLPFLLLILLSTPLFASLNSQFTPKNYSIRVTNTLPHSESSFTQGFTVANGVFYESTGLYNKSTLQILSLKTGEVLQHKKIPPQYFAEGLTVINNKIYQLSYKSRKGFVYNLSDLSLISTFSYPMEGWGLTNDGKNLILSDGTENLYYLDPESFKFQKKIIVRESGNLIKKINELEYIEGTIYANVWKEKIILQIDPSSGRVIGKINIDILYEEYGANKFKNVLNGIAYDQINKKIYITGKFWPIIFEIELIKLPAN